MTTDKQLPQASDQSQYIVDVSPNQGLDVSREEYRVYTFPGGETVRVARPKLLWVKTSSSTPGKHSHRIETKAGTGVYIPAGWIKLEWKNTDPLLPPVSF